VSHDNLGPALAELRAEIREAQKEQHELIRYKFLVIAVLGSVAVGGGFGSTELRLPWVAAFIPLACLYIDLAYYDLDFQVAVIASYIRRHPEHPLGRYEDFVSANISVFSLQFLILGISTAFLGVGVALSGLVVWYTSIQPSALSLSVLLFSLVCLLGVAATALNGQFLAPDSAASRARLRVSFAVLTGIYCGLALIGVVRLSLLSNVPVIPLSLIGLTSVALMFGAALIHSALSTSKSLANTSSMSLTPNRMNAAGLVAPNGRIKFVPLLALMLIYTTCISAVLGLSAESDAWLAPTLFAAGCVGLAGGILALRFRYIQTSRILDAGSRDASHPPPNGQNGL